MTICEFCGTHYSDEQIARLDKMHCLACGGVLKEEEDRPAYIADGGDVMLEHGFWRFVDDPAHQASGKFIEKQITDRFKLTGTLSDNDKDYIDSVYGEGFADDLLEMDAGNAHAFFEKWGGKAGYDPPEGFLSTIKFIGKAIPDKEQLDRIAGNWRLAW